MPVELSGFLGWVGDGGLWVRGGGGMDVGECGLGGLDGRGGCGGEGWVVGGESFGQILN